MNSFEGQTQHARGPHISYNLLHPVAERPVTPRYDGARWASVVVHQSAPKTASNSGQLSFVVSIRIANHDRGPALMRHHAGTSW
jgi:hypothetical protein